MTTGRINQIAIAGSRGETPAPSRARSAHGAGSSFLTVFLSLPRGVTPLGNVPHAVRFHLAWPDQDRIRCCKHSTHDRLHSPGSHDFRPPAGVAPATLSHAAIRTPLWINACSRLLLPTCIATAPPAPFL